MVLEACGSAQVLAVYTASSAFGMAGVAAAEQGCGGGRLVLVVTTGSAYSIAVDGHRGQAGPLLAVALVSSSIRPRTTRFSAAEVLAGAAGSVSASSLGATLESGERAYGGASVWYTWTTPVSGGAVLDTCGSSFDTVLVVHTGTALGSLAPHESSDDACDLSSRVVFRAEAGVTYRVSVEALGGAAISGSRGGSPLAPRTTSPMRRSRSPAGGGAWRGARRAPPGRATSRVLRSREGRCGIAGAAPRAGAVAFWTCDPAQSPAAVGVYRRTPTRGLVPAATRSTGCRNAPGMVTLVPVCRGRRGLPRRGGGPGRRKRELPPALGGAAGLGVPLRRAEPARAAPGRGPARARGGRLSRRRHGLDPVRDRAERGRVVAQGGPSRGSGSRCQGRVRLEVSRGRARR